MNKTRVSAKKVSILHAYMFVIIDAALLYRHTVDNNSALWHLNFAREQEKHAT